MKPVTIHQLLRLCKQVGCYLEVDHDGQCYRASSPQGKRFDPGLHELVAVYGDGILGNGQTKAEARADLAARLEEYARLEECDDPKCDWCRFNMVF